MSERVAYERAIEDFAALRLHEQDSSTDRWMPAAGLPWFMALFGRDSAIAMQRAHFGRLKLPARAEQADLFAWDPDVPFDAVYDQTCLCALPPGLWPTYVRRLHRWLRPDGALFILFMQSNRPNGPPFHCDLGAMRRLFAASAT